MDNPRITALLQRGMTPMDAYRVLQETDKLVGNDPANYPMPACLANADMPGNADVGTVVPDVAHPSLPQTAQPAVASIAQATPYQTTQPAVASIAQATPYQTAQPAVASIAQPTTVNLAQLDLRQSQAGFATQMAQPVVASMPATVNMADLDLRQAQASFATQMAQPVVASMPATVNMAQLTLPQMEEATFAPIAQPASIDHHASAVIEDPFGLNYTINNYPAENWAAVNDEIDNWIDANNDVADWIDSNNGPALDNVEESANPDDDCDSLFEEPNTPISNDQGNASFAEPINAANPNEILGVATASSNAPTHAVLQSRGYDFRNDNNVVTDPNDIHMAIMLQQYNNSHPDTANNGFLDAANNGNNTFLDAANNGNNGAMNNSFMGNGVMDGNLIGNGFMNGNFIGNGFMNGNFIGNGVMDGNFIGNGALANGGVNNSNFPNACQAATGTPEVGTPMNDTPAIDEVPDLCFDSPTSNEPEAPATPKTPKGRPVRRVMKTPRKPKVKGVSAPALADQPLDYYTPKSRSYAEARARRRGFDPNRLVDATIPQTHEEKLVFTKKLAKALLSIEGAEDSQHVLKPFTNGTYSELYVEEVAWRQLDYMIERHTTGTSLTQAFSDKETTDSWNFAKRFQATCDVWATSKSAAKHALDPDYSQTVIDDPEAAFKRIFSNKKVNDRKANQILIGKSLKGALPELADAIELAAKDAKEDQQN